LGPGGRPGTTKKKKAKKGSGFLLGGKNAETRKFNSVVEKGWNFTGRWFLQKNQRFLGSTAIRPLSSWEKNLPERKSYGEKGEGGKHGEPLETTPP